MISLLLILTILYTAFGTMRNSIRSRRAEKGEREAIRAKMNVHMGLMFLCIAGLHVINLSGSFFQSILTLFIALVGFFNLFAGYRNYQRFRHFLK